MEIKLNDRIIINKNWKFSVSEKSYKASKVPVKKIKPGKWFKATVPGTVHTDLLNNKLIDEPFYADNEMHLEWIAEYDWIYKTEFTLKSNKKNYNLVFEGLDTIADVYLNGNLILSSNNMFRSYKTDIEKHLNHGKNELEIRFTSPVNYAIKEEKKYGKLPVSLNTYRAYIRKAQYSYGWDWGPSFPTSGIWRKVYLEKKHEAGIESISFNTKNISRNNAAVLISADIKTKKKKTYKLIIKLDDGESIIEKEITVTGSASVKEELKIPRAKLWWPNGEGEQNLYNMTLTLYDEENNEIHAVEKKVGIRKIELVLKQKNKNTFKFRINNRDIFAKGVNWIPADSFLPRVDKNKYSKLLSLAKEGHMNIVRVWGGGFYENDEFYDLCDELGLLVWQDFMFVCGAYPEHKEFIDNVKEEVGENVIRLQCHASIALWCGNNENEWGWHMSRKTPYNEIPGYKIYNSIIPGILKELDPERPYWQSSPFGYDDDPDSFNSGNTHQWNIWSGWADYNEVKKDESLFVTEFGFQSPANKETFEKYLPEKNRNITDRIFEFHNKQVEGPERVLKFLASHLPVAAKWDDYIYLTQLNQGLALKTCIEHWRANNRTNGSIIWQINDCWPVTSWALIDSELKPKLAYHFVKNIFSPQLVFFTKNKNELVVNLLNKSSENFSGQLKVYFIDAPSGKIVKQLSKKIEASTDGNIIAESFSYDKLKLNKNVIALSYLYSKHKELINTNFYKEQPWKYINTAGAKINIKVIKEGKLLITSDKPVLFVDLYCQGIDFSDRGFSIIPGEEKIVEFSCRNMADLKINDIQIFSLNNYLKQ